MLDAFGKGASEDITDAKMAVYNVGGGSWHDMALRGRCGRGGQRSLMHGVLRGACAAQAAVCASAHTPCCCSSPNAHHCAAATARAHTAARAAHALAHTRAPTPSRAQAMTYDPDKHAPTPPLPHASPPPGPAPSVPGHLPPGLLLPTAHATLAAALGSGAASPSSTAGAATPPPASPFAGKGPGAGGAGGDVQAAGGPGPAGSPKGMGGGGGEEGRGGFGQGGGRAQGPPSWIRVPPSGVEEAAGGGGAGSPGSSRCGRGRGTLCGARTLCVRLCARLCSWLCAWLCVRACVCVCTGLLCARCGGGGSAWQHPCALPGPTHSARDARSGCRTAALSSTLPVPSPNTSVLPHPLCLQAPQGRPI